MPNAVIREILRQGARRPRKHVLAALTTGRVESNFRNLPGGDADSRGWRQERASLYRNPRNLRASVRRFYQEAAQHDRGQGVGELAADVQRPAAQYRGRYAQALPEARRILSSGGGGAGFTRTTRTPGRVSLGFSPGEPANVVSALQALRAAAPQPTATAPAAPAFSAAAPMPQGYQPVETTGVPPRRDTGGALELLGQLANRDVPSDLIQQGDQIDRYTVRGGVARGDGRVNLRPRGGYAGTTGPLLALTRLAHAEGTTTTSAKRDTVSTASGGVSDHYRGNRIANARDIGGSTAQIDRAAVAVARALGIRYRKGKPLVANVNRNGIRYQLLWRTKDHFDHLHIGAKRL